MANCCGVLEVLLRGNVAHSQRIVVVGCSGLCTGIHDDLLWASGCYFGGNIGVLHYSYD